MFAENMFVFFFSGEIIKDLSRCFKISFTLYGTMTWAASKRSEGCVHPTFPVKWLDTSGTIQTGLTYVFLVCLRISGQIFPLRCNGIAYQVLLQFVKRFVQRNPI